MLMGADCVVASKFQALAPHLNERQRRLYLAAEAQALGRGGIARVAEATGVSRITIRNGLRELAAAPLPEGRVRAEGGGRKSLAEHDPELLAALDALVSPSTRGDPMSPLRWTCKSTRQLAQALNAVGHPVGRQVVWELLQAQGYSLQANVKTLEGTQHPDRDAQFQYLNEQTTQFLSRGLPVISVDTKKKELIGQFKNGGREWEPQGQPERVNDHDFMDSELGKAIPYGIFDRGRNRGWVSVGQDHDTASFAVESLRRWWRAEGSLAYAQGKQLLITADCGGSNGYRVRLWKYELARFAKENALTVTVCHLPPGTSKWNSIERRLFAHISMNARARPLTSHEVLISLINATTTRQGLTVHAERDIGTYPAGIKVSDEDMAALHLQRHDFHGDWNYNLLP